MPENNGQNINGVQKNSKNTLNHAQRMIKFRAIMAKKKQTFRAPNSGKFEHLRKTVETFKKNRDAYIKFKNQKMAEEMARKNNEPKPERKIKNENNLVIEEPLIQEEPQKPADKVAKENDTETMKFEDVEVDDADLDDPKLDEELEQLEQKMKKEEELKKKGIDPVGVEKPDDPELTEDIKELMQETDEKLEGEALEEAFQKLSNEVEGEKKSSRADIIEENDPFVDGEIDRLEQEIAAETNGINNNAPQNVNVENAVQNNSSDDEYLGLQELFGEISLDNPSLTQEQQEYVLEQARKRAEADAQKQREQLNPNFMFEQWNRQRMQNGNFGANMQMAPKGNMNPQMENGGMKIPGMSFVPASNPKVEEKKPPVVEQPKKVYVSEKIPGMSNSNFNVAPTNIAHEPKMTQEELDAKFLRDTEEQLAQLRKTRPSDPDERRARATLERQLQKIIDDAKAVKALREQAKALDEAEKTKKDNEVKSNENKEQQAPAQNNIVEPQVAPNEVNAAQNIEQNEAQAENNERQLTEEEKARRAADDERLAQLMQNFRRDMDELDAEEAREIKENEEIEEPEQKQEREPRTLDFLFEEDDEELDPFAAPTTIQIPNMPENPVANAEPQVEANEQENANPQRELTEEEKARRAAEDERLAQMMQNFRRDMDELDAEEAREIKENEEIEEPEQKQERPARPLDFLFEEDDEELDPFAAPTTIQIPKMPENPVANAELQVEANEQQNEVNANAQPRELTEEEKARRAAEDERLAQIMQNFRRDMDELDAEEEREAQENEEKAEVEQKQERPARPLDFLFEEDDEELDPFAAPTTIQIPKMPENPVANAEPKVVEANEQENANPQRELTEEEKARRAAEDERLAQIMQNHRRDMEAIEAEEAAEEAKDFDIFGNAVEMIDALNVEPQEIDNGVSSTVFVNALGTFNAMYKLGINPDSFALAVNEAWTLLKSGNEQKKADGQKMLGDLFKDTLKQAFDIEKEVAYDEHRLPEYAEIIKSSNELLRASMFAFTDLYHNPKSAVLFASTACGGLNAKDMAELTIGDSLWSMDQKSDEAWELQSKDAKKLADKWLTEDKPYEKMIGEMKALVEANKNGAIDRKEILTKLTAAEWLLVNNDKMMIDDPEDPLNKLPNWGNRYWKALTEARESLGIDKHTSMRDLIQGDYAASAKAVISAAYNEAQINDYVLDPAAREIYDSMELQKERFATQSAAVTLTEPINEKNVGEVEMTEDRVPFPIKELDERTIMKNQPKNYDFVIERTAELTLGPN